MIPTNITCFWKQNFLIKLVMTILQLENSFSCMEGLVNTDTVRKLWISLVPDELSQYHSKSCLEETGKIKVFLFVQSTQLQVYFSVSLQHEEHCVAMKNRKKYKYQMLISFLLKREYMCASWFLFSFSFFSPPSPPTFSCIAQGGRPGSIYVLILSGNCFSFSFACLKNKLL